MLPTASASWRKLALGCIALATAVACIPSDDSVTQDYAKRLSKILQRELPPAQPAQLNYPRPRDLSVEQTTTTISVREFLSLRQCEVHSALANKNSLLGKFAKSSQALFLDLAILYAGSECVAQLQANKQLTLARRLAQQLEHKEQQLPRLLWRAILGADENAAFWSITASADNYPSESSNRPIVAIQELSRDAKRILGGDYNLTYEQQAKFEKQLQGLRSGDGGVLFRHLTALSSSLQVADSMLAQRLTKPLCLQTAPTPKARYLQNVVERFFIPKVQKSAVLLHQRYRQLMPAYLELEQILVTGAPRAYQNWAKQRQQYFAKGLSASKEHVLLIQKIYQQCGLRVG